MAFLNMTIRIPREEKDLMEKAASDRRVSSGEIARIAIRRYLAGFNPEHEEVLERFSKVEARLEEAAAQLRENSLLVAATMTAALLLDKKQDMTNEELADMVRRGIAMASGSASKVLQHIRDGIQ
jgi:hypothetical protein